MGLGILAISPAAAAEPLRELCADRPGKDAPPCIVDKGHVLIEIGAFRYSREGGEEDVSEYGIGEVLARYGLTDTVEVQLGFAPYTLVRLTDPATGRRRTLEGAGDLTGALKVNLMNPDGSGTSAALQAFVTAPTGKAGIGSGAWEAGIIAPISFELSDKMGLTIDPEIDWLGDEDGTGHHLAFVGVASLSRDLGGGFEGSAEIWSMVDRDPAGHTTQASFDLSLAWVPEKKPNLQFDVEVDLGMTEATPSVEAAAGLAYRF